MSDPVVESMNLNPSSEEASFLEIARLIDAARDGVLRAVNTGLIDLY